MLFKKNFAAEFIEDYSLKNPVKHDELEEAEINQYGDIVISYMDTYGNIREGFICTNEWGAKAAEKYCITEKETESGMPTWDGMFTKERARDVNFAVSTIACTGQESK